MIPTPAKDKAIGLVLAVLVIPTGGAVLSIAGNIAGVVEVDPGLVWLVVFGLVLIVPGAVLLLSYLPTLRAAKVYPVETVTVADSAPELPDTLIVDGNLGEYVKPDKQVITPKVIKTLAQGIVKGEGLGFDVWVNPKGSPFTRAEYISIRDELISEGVWQWRGRGNRAGLELTSKGSRFFAFWHKVLNSETPPTPGEYRQGVKVSRLTNIQTNRQTYRNIN